MVFLKKMNLISSCLFLVLPILAEEVKENELVERLSVTKKDITINGQEIGYTVTTGTMVLKNEDGEGEAEVFYIAYARDDTRDFSRRPVTFSFNGGPGSSSVWLHLGALGPKRVVLDEDGGAFRPPPKLVENESTILDRTDLVFIDPVSTGFSKSAKDVDPAKFHGYRNDLESVAEFIRLYVSRNERWRSPKFVIGESYGTVRAAGLVDHLQARHGMYINGVMLISAALDYMTGDVHPGNDLPFVMFLPTYAASALYHGKVSGVYEEDLARVVAEAEAFALGPYHNALMKGDLLTKDEFSETAAQIARFTGLSIEYVKRNNLRVPLEQFCQELLRGANRTIGRLDTRLKGITGDPTSPVMGDDPSLTAIWGPYSAAMNAYLGEELDFETDAPYRVFGPVGSTWKWDAGSYINVSEPLRQAMVRNPHLKVFVGSGYFDLATPYFATEYTFNHMGLDEVQKQNVTFAYYKAGHMMYIHQPSLVKFKADLVAFINSACPR